MSDITSLVATAFNVFYSLSAVFHNIIPLYNTILHHCLCKITQPCPIDYFPPIFIIWKENHPLNAVRFFTFTCKLSNLLISLGNSSESTVRASGTQKKRTWKTANVGRGSRGSKFSVHCASHLRTVSTRNCVGVEAKEFTTKKTNGCKTMRMSIDQIKVKYKSVTFDVHRCKCLLSN